MEYRVSVESVIVTDHTVEADSGGEAEDKALVLAKKEVPGAEEHRAEVLEQ